MKYNVYVMFKIFLLINMIAAFFDYDDILLF